MNWIKKLKKFFMPYSNDNENTFIRMKAKQEAMEEVYQRADEAFDKYVEDLQQHIDRRIEHLLQSRAAARTPQGKKSYNGTIKELRTIKEML